MDGRNSNIILTFTKQLNVMFKTVKKDHVQIIILKKKRELFKNKLLAELLSMCRKTG